MNVAPLRTLIPDGVYTDMDFETYLADDATSGSDCLKLLTDPGALQWENERTNPLWIEPEKKPATRGQATHAAVLEGIAAYEARFCVPPEGVLKTGDDMSEWLRARELKISGSVGERRQRIEQARETLPIDQRPVFFDEAVGGRTVISQKDDLYVRVLADFVRNDPAVQPYLAGGLAEVSVFATIDGHRYKGRIDFMGPRSLVNLKTYMRAPTRGYDLTTFLVRNMYYRGSDLQAVVHSRVVQAAAARGLPVFGERADEARAILKVMSEDKRPPVYRWLFVRTEGAPTAIVMPFRESDLRWQSALSEIALAVDVLKRYRATCGDGNWTTTFGEREIDPIDWPGGLPSEITSSD